MIQPKYLSSTDLKQIWMILLQNPFKINFILIYTRIISHILNLTLFVFLAKVIYMSLKAIKVLNLFKFNLSLG